MNYERVLELMREAIIEAQKSKSEDDRPRPYVGAIMCDDDGKVLLRAHRGEVSDGGHAEYTLFEKAKKQNIDPKGKTLFVTLEPCTRRGAKKIPCAVRIVSAGIKRIYVGTSDPNPNISGRSEAFLFNSSIEVERFPSSLMLELMQLNKSFFDEHTPYSAPVVSLEGLSAADAAHAVEGNRESLLQTSLDLIAYSAGPVSVFSGASSWARELQVGLLMATMQGRQCRVLCDLSNVGQAEYVELPMRLSALVGAGASVAVTNKKIELRGTLAGNEPASATMLSIEKNPALHGLRLSGPHEQGILSTMQVFFDQEWKQGTKVASRKPLVEALSVDYVAKVLSENIGAYSQATFQRTAVAPSKLKLLTKNIERYKLFRISVLESMKAKFRLPEMGRIDGSPWPYILPLVERQADGSLVVVDGAHRVWHSLYRSRDEMPIILIEGVNWPLPAKPVEHLDAVAVTFQKWSRQQRYDGYDPSLFRPIHQVLKDVLWKTTDKKILEELNLA